MYFEDQLQLAKRGKQPSIGAGIHEAVPAVTPSQTQHRDYLNYAMSIKLQVVCSAPTSDVHPSTSCAYHLVHLLKGSDLKMSMFSNDPAWQTTIVMFETWREQAGLKLSAVRQQAT